MSSASGCLPTASPRSAASGFRRAPLRPAITSPGPFEGITAIISPDQGFDQVAGLRRIDPTDPTGDGEA